MNFHALHAYYKVETSSIPGAVVASTGCQATRRLHYRGEPTLRRPVRRRLVGLVHPSRPGRVGPTTAFIGWPSRDVPAQLSDETDAGKAAEGGVARRAPRKLVSSHRLAADQDNWVTYADHRAMGGANFRSAAGRHCKGFTPPIGLHHAKNSVRFSVEAPRAPCLPGDDLRRLSSRRRHGPATVVVARCLSKEQPPGGPGQSGNDRRGQRCSPCRLAAS
jgi:hypothetical protein